jgi:hypothetical protein
MTARLGGITQSGSSGSFSYSVKTGFADKPVNFVSFYDSLRFANWLENGQPTGAQGNATTEDGAYTITAAGILANSITRNSGATIFLTSEDEWQGGLLRSRLQKLLRLSSGVEHRDHLRPARGDGEHGELRQGRQR